MRRLLAIAIALAFQLGPSSSLAAQSEDEEVLEVIQTLFRGMRSADTLLVRSTLHTDARIVAIDSREGRRGSRAITPEEFVAAVGGSEGRWDERIWSPEIRFDGDLALVWAPYDFHVDGRFSHCGVDGFSLIRTEAGWKIVSIVYTRRSEGCEGPPEG